MNKFTSDDLDDESEEKLPPRPDPLLEKVKAYILSTYEPVQDPSEADTHMSTQEILDAVHRLYPNPFFTSVELANWLHEQGFTFYDAGKMRFEWLLKNNK